MKYLFITLCMLFGINAQAQTAQPNAAGVYGEPGEKAYFPYGQDSLDRYIKHNIHFERIGKDVKGSRAIVIFIVETDGSINKAEILSTSGDTRFDEEAVRVIKTLRGWKPAKDKGIAVRSTSMLSVVYQLK